ncbi:Putative SNARE-complex protein Syntaxin-18 [Septoria linicola]|uniref:SNARE-complex protein Syntaxin-18 n=1 Tax=Septoria linicola TaxID=215465 RepID=A0A9Q9ARR7_9PEZI|nr:putative SNARE-complex protein Syntaxin-18 [Septoria linicola]USW54562.1 Putative SNARE-complex protein Syntaxin-18 [Septoria linicola]
MTDITADFNVCLKSKAAEPVLRKTYDLQTINSFLQEAYSIYARISDLNRELRTIRPAYLSAAQPSRRRHIGGDSSDRARPLTDAERDAIDAQSKQLLRQLNGAITGLQQAEQVRNQTHDNVALQKRARGGLMGLGRWAAGGAQTAKSPEEELEEAARKSIMAVREAIIMYLNEKLGEASRMQSEMMDTRLTREMEKTKSILAKSPTSAAVPRYMDDADSPATPQSANKRQRFSADMGSIDTTVREELSQEQLQLFAEENHELLKNYEDQLDQVRTAEKSILEISELHSTLHANLTQQAEHIDQLVQDSYLTTENLGKGNKELKRASERRSTAQAVFWSTCAFCGFLVVWDLVF